MMRFRRPLLMGSEDFFDDSLNIRPKPRPRTLNPIKARLREATWRCIGRDVTAPTAKPRQ